MKRFSGLIAVFLAMIIALGSFGFAVSAEPVEGEPDFTVKINCNLQDALTYTYNGASGGAEYKGVAADGRLTVVVAVKDGYKMTDAEFGGSYPPISGEKSVSYTFKPASGGNYEFSITAELIPVPVKVSFDLESGVTCAVDGIADPASHEFFKGDSLTLRFTFPEGSSAADYIFTVNGTESPIGDDGSASVSLSGDTVFAVKKRETPPPVADTYKVLLSFKGPGSVRVYDYGAEQDGVKGDSYECDNPGTEVKSEGYTFKTGTRIGVLLTPATGYESQFFTISDPKNGPVEPNNKNHFVFTLRQDTAVTVIVKKSGDTPTPTDKLTLNVSAGTGGKVTVGGKNVQGIFTAQYDKNTVITIAFAANNGYLLDSVTRDGAAVAVTGSSIKITMTADTTVRVSFKKEGGGNEDPVTPENVITAAGIVWTSNPVRINISEGKLVAPDVFARIAALTGNGSVEFVSAGGTISIPFGASVTAGANVDMSVAKLTSGSVYDEVTSAIRGLVGSEPVCMPFSLPNGLPASELTAAGATVSFNTGALFADEDSVYLLSYDRSRTVTEADEKGVDTAFSLPFSASEGARSGTGGVRKYAYDGSGVVLLSRSAPELFRINSYVLNAGGSITPLGTTKAAINQDYAFRIAAEDGYHIKQILVDGSPLEISEGLRSYTFTFERVGRDHTVKAEFVSDTAASDESESGSSVGKVLIIILIVLVAAGGAAALFIVKWRQEKF